MSKVTVGIVMGSKSDLTVMNQAVEVLKEFDVPHEVTVVSAHRTPDRMMAYGESAVKRGLKVIVAGAGGAAHLPGMIASTTTLPVIGVPIKSSNSLDGWDSLLSIAQMPKGVPVATVAVDGAYNAGLLAVQLLALDNKTLAQKLDVYKQTLKDKVQGMISDLTKEGFHQPDISQWLQCP